MTERRMLCVMRPLIFLALLTLAHPGAPMAKPRVIKQLVRVTVPMPLGINVHYGPLPAAAGPRAGGYADGNDIYLPPHPDAWSRAHEYGHQLDGVLTDRDRQRFERIIGAYGPWVTSDGTVEGSYGSPHEWFADYYAAAATGYDPTKQFQESYATVSPKRLKRFQKSLVRLAARRPDLIQYR